MSSGDFEHKKERGCELFGTFGDVPELSLRQLLHYPSFCPGFGIVLSPDVVNMFVDLFDVLPPFRLDDVYIGMLANTAGVTPIHNPNFEVWPTPKTKCRWKNSTIARHAVTGDCLYKVFNEMHSQ